ncbi:MAG: DUF5615 family PIN-like protein [Burkholderiales bacterium]
MKIVVDMNLSPRWVQTLRAGGFEAEHWSALGPPNAPDEEIMRWARENGCVVFTNDLDFGAILAHAQAAKPSVVQIRTPELDPLLVGPMLLEVLHKFEADIATGALISVDSANARVRALPLN